MNTNILPIIILVCILIVPSFADDWQNYRTDNSPINSNHITSVSVDSQGIKWFGSDSGLIGYDNNQWFLYTTSDNLADNFVRQCAYEHSQSVSDLWLATAGGISEIDVSNPGTAMISPPINTGNSELVSDNVISVAIDTGNVKWFGTDLGLSIFTGSMWETFSVNDILPHNIILNIFSKSDGWNYLATAGGGVARLIYDDVDGITSASVINTNWSGIASDTVNCVFIDSDDISWYGTKYGVSRHEGEYTEFNWDNYTDLDGLINNNVISIAEDNDGAIWFGTTGGLSRYFDNKWIGWTSQNGLAGDSVYDIALDPDGSLWFATNNGISNLTPQSVSVNQLLTTQNSDPLDVTVYPNPFNLQARIIVNLSRNMNISVDIFNILGQKVRRLYYAMTASGNHRIYWDGTDVHGAPLVSGLYFLQITGDRKSIVKKLMLLK